MTRDGGLLKLRAGEGRRDSVSIVESFGTVCVCMLVSHGVGSRGSVWVGTEGVGIRGCSLKLAGRVRVRQT